MTIITQLDLLREGQSGDMQIILVCTKAQYESSHSFPLSVYVSNYTNFEVVS